MVDIVRQCLTHDYRRRPDTFALLRNAAVQNKADALKISLRPKPRERKKTAPRAEASVAPPEELPSEEAQVHFQRPRLYPATNLRPGWAKGSNPWRLR